ncbi:hypothetical protein [Klebsiella pneumoniae]|uniref:hypothetical protein n=1 Tax=Klebsiella pneumoniae TaxID=573 RepID=UPI00299F8A60|nr:hypothetical protein [Klebsiella pneumoniae]
METLNQIPEEEHRRQSIHILTRVWDACANMERYIQYGFTPQERHRLFGESDWGQFVPRDFAHLLDLLDPQTRPTLPIKRAAAGSQGRTLLAILQDDKLMVSRRWRRRAQAPSALTASSTSPTSCSMCCDS